jgi:hypothetical protein
MPSILVTLGLVLYAYGSTKHRLPHAPIPFNGPRGWPWQHRDWFTRRGRIYRNVGLVLLSIGGVLAVFSLLSR